jgi:hypothetical protein
MSVLGQSIGVGDLALRPLAADNDLFISGRAYGAAKLCANPAPRNRRMSPVGPSRHFDAAQQFGCFRSEADIDLGGRATPRAGC